MVETDSVYINMKIGRMTERKKKMSNLKKMNKISGTNVKLYLR